MDYRIIKHEHIFETAKYFPQCHASTIEVLPDNTITSAWFAGKKEKSNDVSIWFSKRDDKAWSEPKPVANGNGEPCWNPVLFYTGESLKLYYKVGYQVTIWRTYVIESYDGGSTWSDAVELVVGDIGGRGPVKNKCIKLSNGNVLAPASIETDTEWTCFADISADNGRTFTKSSDIPVNLCSFVGKGLIQPTLWESSNGTVHALMRSTEGAIYKSCSFDGGANWDNATRLSLPNNNSGIDVTKLDDGRLVLVYNPISGNWRSRSQIAFSVSNDNGKTWSSPNNLDFIQCDKNEERTEFSYPAIVARGNKIYITYTYKRNNVSFWEIELEEKYNSSENGMLNGVFATMITPFTNDNKVDFEALSNLVEWYISKGVHGLFAVCQSSEMFYLSREEKKEIADFVMKKAAGRAQVVVSGHTADDINTQIEELKDMEKIESSAVVLVTNRLAKEGESEEVWKENATKILEALPNCKFGLYECPYPYKRLLSTELLKWCADTGRFLFIKDTCCDIDMIKDRLDALNGSILKLYNANSATILESLQLGASGYCGIMANFHPEIYVWLVEHYKKNRQISEQIQNFASLSAIIELRDYPANSKYNLQLMGYNFNIYCRKNNITDIPVNDKSEIRAMKAMADSLYDNLVNLT